MNQSYRKTTNGVVAAVTSVFLAACGSGGGGGGSTDANTPQALGAKNGTFAQIPANTVKRIGTVFFEVSDAKSYVEAGLSGSTTVYGEFVEYTQPMSEVFIHSEFSMGERETCVVSIDSTDGSQDVGLETDPDILEFQLDASSISAGDALSISTPDGSWPDVLATEDNYGYRSVYYDFEANTSTIGELPSESTLSIPGDEFPAFVNVVIPNADKITDASLLNLTNGRITKDTRVTWQRSSQSTSNAVTTIALYVEEYDDATNNELLINIHCNVIDDGEFSFPDNAKQLLSTYHFSNEDIWLARGGLNTVIQDDAAMLVGNASFYFFR